MMCLILTTCSKNEVLYLIGLSPSKYGWFIWLPTCKTGNEIKIVRLRLLIERGKYWWKEKWQI